MLFLSYFILVWLLLLLLNKKCLWKWEFKVLLNMCDTNDEQPLEQQTYYSRVIPIVELD